MHLAVDGVVPMAKIKQQRLRRFKSVWMAAAEREQGVRVAGEEVWDTNAITPGTEFMEKLSVALKGLKAARGGAGWIVSGAEEPGEGEQKLMEWVRGQGAALDGKTVWVYGLDADLIVLCLYHAGVVAPGAAGWRILRETQEFGGLGGGAATEEFLLLDVNGLLGTLFPAAATRSRDLLDYICGMSLLGNDFLPHSLSVSIRDAGHDRLVAALAALHKDGGRLVSEDKRVVTAGLLHIVRGWATEEADSLCRAFQKKYAMRALAPRSETERAMMPVQNLPLEWAAETALWSKESGQLLDGWQSTYYGGSIVQQDIHQRCVSYGTGLQWIVDYYTGRKPVSKTWLYAWSLPPLWSDLAQMLEGLEAVEEPPAPVEPALKPQEQLSMVLPLESWWLIRDTRLKALPSKLPHFWPKTFEFESLGKRWMWECHPVLPILGVSRLAATVCK